MNIYNCNYPITIVEGMNEAHFINPGGKIITKEYDKNFGPFSFKESDIGEKFIHLNTLEDVKIQKIIYKNLDEYYFKTKAKYNSFYRNLVLYDKENLKKCSIPGQLKILSLDLEMFTAGYFPKADKDPIISYGLHVMGTEYLDPKNNAIIVDIDFKKEKRILEGLIDHIERINPDIIAGYFIVDFDLHYLYQRLAKHKIPINCLNRIKDKKEKDDYGYYLDKKGKFNFTSAGRTLGKGRVMYDVYTNSVKGDTSLQNLKNRRLKTVAEYFGLKDIYNLTDDEKNNMSKLSNKKILTYQKSDLRCTPFVVEKYIQTSIQLSNLQEWTMDMAINRTSGMLGNNIIKQQAYKEGYITLKSNFEIFKEIFNLIDSRTKGKIKGKFEGAYNFAKEYNISEQIQKHDFASEYPNIARNFLLSPDTTTLESIEELDYDKIPIKNPWGIDINCCIGFKKYKGYNIYSIPDRNLNKRFIIKVLDKKDNIYFRMLTQGLDTRTKIKKLIKDITNIYEILIQEGIANNWKIFNNAVYGLNGSKYFDTGSIIIAIFITAVGREVGMSLHNRYIDEVVAIDTDGLMFNDFNKSAKETNSAVKHYLKTKFDFDDCYLILKAETEKPTSLLQALKKNYVTYCSSEPEGKQIKLVGANFKSSSLPAFIDDIIKNDIMLPVFKLYEAQNLTVKEVKKIEKNCTDIIKNAPVNLFAASFRINKELEEYSGINSPSYRISQVIENKKYNDKSKRKLIEVILKIEAKNSNDLEIIEWVDEVIQKQKPLNFYYSFALYHIDDLEQRSYSMSVKILDLYNDRYGSYPVGGNTIEYYYSRTGLKVDLFENLKNKSQIDYDRYESIITRSIDTVLKCIKDEDSF